MRRRIMASLGGKSLPYLRRVAYINSVDGAYVDLGIPWSTDYNADVEFRVNKINFTSIFGARDINAGGAGYYIGTITDSTGERFHFDSNGTRVYSTYANGPEIGVNYRLARDARENIATIYKDGSLVQSISLGSYTRKTGSREMIAFGGNGAGSKVGTNTYSIRSIKVAGLSLVAVLDLDVVPCFWNESYTEDGTHGLEFYRAAVGSFGYEEFSQLGGGINA